MHPGGIRTHNLSWRAATGTGDTTMSLTKLNDSPAQTPSFNTYDASASTTNMTKGWFHLAGSRAFTKKADKSQEHENKIRDQATKDFFQLRVAR
jgi:hypothetical protein